MNMLKGNAKPPEPMPQPQRPKVPAPPAPPALADDDVPAEVKQQLAVWHQMAKDNATLKTRVQQLLNDLTIANARIQDLQHDVSHERALKERFQRFAVKFADGAGRLAREAHAIQDDANAFALEHEKHQLPPPGEIEDEISGITQSLKSHGG